MGNQIKDAELLRQIALKLKRLRETKGVSQRDVLDETDIHIARIETAKVNISVSTLAGLCRYFNISLADFFTGL